jgi:4,5-DOPA dioxygenase extradiol
MGFASLLSMKATERMPVLFVGHGSPTSAISPNSWTKAWSDVGPRIPRPNAILSISAHWITNGGMLVTASPRPQINYDMGGFPPEMYQLKYPAPGNPALAKEIATSLQKAIPVQGDISWGIDHGTWLILRYMFPKADIPLIQLSIDYSKPPAFHFDLAKQLQSLRDRGVLILGSGNLVHNLREMVRADVKPFDWAVEFDRRMDDYIREGNYKAVVDFQKLGSLASAAHPTYDHFLPLLYVLGLQARGEQVQTFTSGFQYKSVSMRSYQIS